MNISRLFRHLVVPAWSMRKVFDAPTAAAIERTIAEGEGMHGGEVRFAVEGALNAVELLRGVTPRERALQVFSQLGIWDTEANNGVLIYVLWADRDVEIVADRGFNARVSAQEWTEVCSQMERHFGRGNAQDAVIEGIRAVSALIARHYPVADGNELPNRPVLL